MLIMSIDEHWILADENADAMEARFFKRGEKYPATELFFKDEYKSPALLKHDFARVVRLYNQRGYSAYFPFNAIRTDFERGSVKDADITHLNYLFVDIDRQGSPKDPATDEELEHGRKVAESVRVHMLELGWDEPLLTCSGNGYHLYFPLHKLANDEEAVGLIKKLLIALGEKFDNQHVGIDRVVHNPSRLTKILGAVAYKGQASEERPYREARLVK